jgi:inner membrane transporter RhtA
LADTAAAPPPRDRRIALWPVLLLLVAMMSMQVGAAYAKGLFPIVGAQGATALRLGFSALILAAVQRPWRGFRPRATLWILIAYGLCLGAMNTLFYMALRTTPIGIAVALEFVGPLSVAALGSRRWIDLVWVVLAVVGLGLLLPLRRAAHAVDPVGAGLALASGGFWALYIIFGRRVGKAYGSRGAALGMIIAAAAFVPVGIAGARPGAFSLALAPSGLLLALLSSAAPYSLELVALARIPARAFGTLMSLEPAVGALAGLAMLHEQLSATQWLGVAAVIAASFGTSLTPETRSATMP